MAEPTAPSSSPTARLSLWDSKPHLLIGGPSLPRRVILATRAALHSSPRFLARRMAINSADVRLVRSKGRHTPAVIRSFLPERTRLRSANRGGYSLRLGVNATLIADRTYFVAEAESKRICAPC